MNTERLGRLATNLENWDEYMTKLTRPMSTFNIGTWVFGSDCCAIGAAGLDPAFNAEGFKLAWATYELGIESALPVFEGRTCFDAVAMFFDIDIDTVRRFFHENHYYGKVTPQMVAARIRTYIEENTPVEVAPTTVKNLGFNFFKNWLNSVRPAQVKVNETTRV